MARPGTRSALRWLVLAASFALGAYFQAGGLLPSILRHSGAAIYLARHHVWLVAVTGDIALLVAVPLGILPTCWGLARPSHMGQPVATYCTPTSTLTNLDNRQTECRE